MRERHCRESRPAAPHGRPTRSANPIAALRENPFMSHSTPLRIPTRVVFVLLIAAATVVAGACRTEAPAPDVPPPSAETFARLSERVDPWVPRPRVVIMTDIANEPDDQMSM